MSTTDQDARIDAALADADRLQDARRVREMAALAIADRVAVGLDPHIGDIRRYVDALDVQRELDAFAIGRAS